MNKLVNTIKDIDQRHSAAPSADLYKERMALQTEFNSLTSAHTQGLFLKSRMTHYEHGERASKLLCHQLRQSTVDNLVTEITTPDGNTTSDQVAINNRFRAFYVNLYSSDIPNDSCSTDFFQTLQLTALSPEEASSLDGGISETEINQANHIDGEWQGPGPRRLPNRILYEIFWPAFTIAVQGLCRGSTVRLLTPHYVSGNNISPLKEGQKPTLCDSYRPISLVCCDNKILAKVLALRLKTVLHRIIHPDQTGFMKGRQSFGNLRRLYNILYSDPAPTPEVVVVSLDAHKAFDRIEFDYLFTALDKFGFISWIKLLYSAPQAAVRTNGTISKYFPLQRGTRQGCPLSPLLFDIAIEPLAVSLRNRKDFTGIVRGGVTHKLSLYTDDLLLYCSDPLLSAPVALDIINSFGRVSGYKINLTKSVLFPIGSSASRLSFTQLPFKVTTDSFTCFGLCA